MITHGLTNFNFNKFFPLTLQNKFTKLSVPYRGRCDALDCQIRVFIIGCKHDQPWWSWAVAEVSDTKGSTKMNSVFYGKLTVLLLGEIKRIQKARAPIQIILFVFTREINQRAIEYTFMTLVLYKICTALKFSLDSIILTTILRKEGTR
jgi:hypothetical protein